jgi:hypothetical protein
MSLDRTRYLGVFRRGSRYVAIVSFKDGAQRRQQWLTRATGKEARDAKRDLEGDRPGTAAGIGQAHRRGVPGRMARWDRQRRRSSPAGARPAPDR